MPTLMEPTDLRTMEERLRFLARNRYRIPVERARDVLQEALATFLEVRHRYENEDEHARILVGIFRNKCREYIDRAVRQQKKDKKLKEALVREAQAVSAVPPETTHAGGLLDELVERENGGAILEAINDLRPEAREMFRLIIQEEYSREDLIRHYEVNKNTLDSRLRTYRIELMRQLERRGIRLKK